jgi:hypothetical protein
MNNFKEMTLELIKNEELELVKSEVRDTLMDVFRENFDLWTRELFPLLTINKKNKYQYLAELLGKGGYVVSVEQIGLYLSKVRKERGVRKYHRKKDNEE